MSDDSFTQVTEQSWFSRLGGAIKGVLFGLLLFVAAFPLLFWNEGRAVRTHKTLQEGARSVVSVPADQVDAANEGRLVHVSGTAATKATVQDPEFDVSATGVLQLRRVVEMYQWKESSRSRTEKNLGGGTTTTTTYDYDRVWSAEYFDSTRFNKVAEHANPPAVSYLSRNWLAEPVTLGAFQVPPSLAWKIDATSSFAIPTNGPLPGLLAGKGRRQVDGFYVGSDPTTPQIGDVRIRFLVVNPTAVSVIARQAGGSFDPFTARTGKPIEMLQLGTVAADLMFQQAERSNQWLTWILRLVGFFAMFLGVTLVLRPLSVLGDVLPILGSLLEFGIGLVAFLVAAPLTLVTIAIAWIVYRPLLGIALIATAAGVAHLVRKKLLLKKASRVPAAAGA